MTLLQLSKGSVVNRYVEDEAEASIGIVEGITDKSIIVNGQAYCSRSGFKLSNNNYPLEWITRKVEL